MGKKMSRFATEEERREDNAQLDHERKRQMTDDEMAWLIEVIQKGLDEGDERIGTGAKILVKTLRKNVQKAKEDNRRWFNRDMKRFGKSSRRLWSWWEITAMSM